MKPARVASVVVLAALAGGSAARAQAQPATPPASSDPAREQARVAFAHGVELIEQSRWLEAITALERARDLRRTPAVMYNLGLAQRAVGRLTEAARSFREFLELTASGGDAELRQRVETYLRELAAGLARVTIGVNVAGARLRLDERDVRAGEETAVDPGRHTLVVEAEGHATATRALELRPGEHARIALDLVADIPRRAEPAVARLVVESNVGEAEIVVDGRTIGHGRADEGVAPGHHVLLVRARDRAAFQREFDAVAGGTTRVSASLQDARGIAASPWFWTGVGVGVAALIVVGIVVLAPQAEPLHEGSWGLVPNALGHGAPWP